MLNTVFGKRYYWSCHIKRLIRYSAAGRNFSGKTKNCRSGGCDLPFAYHWSKTGDGRSRIIIKTTLQVAVVWFGLPVRFEDWGLGCVTIENWVRVGGGVIRPKLIVLQDLLGPFRRRKIKENKCGTFLWSHKEIRIVMLTDRANH